MRNKYNVLLYKEINGEYLKKNNNDMKLLQEEMRELDEVIKNNPVAVIDILESFFK